MKRISLIGIRNKYNPAEAPKKVKGLNRQKGWQTIPTMVKGSTSYFFETPLF